MTHFSELTHALRRNGADVHLVVPSYARGNRHFSDRIHYVWAWKRSIVGYLLFELHLAFVLVLLVLRERPSVIYCRIGLATLFPGLIARLLGIPYVVEVNGLTWEELKSRGFPWWITSPIDLVERFNYFLAKRIICVTAGLKTELAASYGLEPGKLDVVLNGANVEAFHPMDRAKARQQVGIPHNQYVVGFVGAMAPWQALDDAIHGLALARDRGCSAMLALVGDGEVRPQLEQLVSELDLKEAVTFYGRRPYEEIPTFLAAFDVALALSKRAVGERIGRSPLKLSEYMASGKAIIASEVTGVREMVMGSGGGLLVAPESPTQIADALIELQDAAKRQELEICSRRAAMAEYSWDASARKTVAIFQQAQ